MSDLRKKLIRLAYEKPELRNHLLPLIKQGASDSVWHIHWTTAASKFLEGVAEKVVGYLEPVYATVDEHSFGSASFIIKFKQVKPAPRNYFFPEDDPIPEWGEITLQMNMFDGLEITGECSIAGKKTMKTKQLSYQALSRANYFYLVSEILELMDMGRIM